MSESLPYQQERPDSPVSNNVSMKTDESMNAPMRLTEDSSTDHAAQDTSENDPRKMGGTSEGKEEDRRKSSVEEQSIPSQQEKPDSPIPSNVSMKSDESMNAPMRFTEDSSTDHAAQEMSENEPGKMGGTSGGKEDRRKSSVEEQRHIQMEMLQNHKACLQKKFQCLSEGVSKENPAILSDIYTELYIIEGGSGEVNDEHEVRHIETASKNAEPPGTPINFDDIFKPLPQQDKSIRTVLTTGVAGIGKTVSVQKFILDWAEGKSNQDIHCIVPLPFRELNQIKMAKNLWCSLVELIQYFCDNTCDIKDCSILTSDKFKVLFILDGLDEYRYSLDFQFSPRWSDVTKPTMVFTLLTNLIKGTLLPSALIWITSRPAAANRIPPEYVDKMTDVRGFNDPQKEEYFRKRISNEILANKIIKHLKSSRSLYIMCHIPVFCWISATVLEKILSETERGEIPRTLTQMYTHFLMIQTHLKQKYTKKETDEEMILKLGKLAFQQLEKSNLIFYERDLRECGIEVTEASVYSGVCTQIFKEKLELYQERVFCFVHLSIQEHLAALYVHLTLITQKNNVLKPFVSMINCLLKLVTGSLYDLHKTAVDKALQSKNGHLDLFLRFLLGLSLESNQNLLKDLLPQSDWQSQSTEDTVRYIKQKIKKNPSSEKCINLFHCLNELNDQSLVQEIQSYLKSRPLEDVKLSPTQWSAVAFVLLTSEQELDEEFDLSKYSPSETCLLGLLPVVKASKSAVLGSCHLTTKSCAFLASVLSSGSSLRQLDLSDNKLLDSGVTRLSPALKHPRCKLEKLQLYNCRLTEKSCSSLASALSSGSSLTQLDLSGNKLLDSGVTCLSAALRDPLCRLEKLELRNCSLTEQSCSSLASALRSDSSLTQLDLRGNKLKDSDVEPLSALQRSPGCKLQGLQWGECPNDANQTVDQWSLAQASLLP